MKLIKINFLITLIFFMMLCMFSLLFIDRGLVVMQHEYFGLNRKYVALTFDDGPKKSVTSELLKELRVRNAKATFFVLGNKAEKNPDLIKQIIMEGHQIGNHTYDHQNFNKLTDEEVTKQITRTNEIVFSITGIEPKILRPGYGLFKKRNLKNNPMPIILWSIDTKDWRLRNSKKIYQKNINKIKDGDIVLMHDVFKATVKAAVMIIDHLQEEGFEFVTIDELAKIKEMKLEANKEYFSFHHEKEDD